MKLVFSESYERFEDKYERGNHSIGISMWEFEFCPKYRYKMFRKWKYKKLIEACIKKAASVLVELAKEYSSYNGCRRRQLIEVG